VSCPRKHGASANADDVMGNHLNTAEAAEWLGLSERTLEDWRADEVGPVYVKISPRCIRYAMEDLIKWRDERRHVPSIQAAVEETIPNVALRAKARKRST
jgi:hypothetical protein